MYVPSLSINKVLLIIPCHTPRLVFGLAILKRFNDIYLAKILKKKNEKKNKTKKEYESICLITVGKDLEIFH